MRLPKYISPSALGRWESSREDFYKKYLCEHPMPHEPQTRAMAVGSAFNAYVKAALYRTLYGSERAMKDDFNLDTLMESQVEEPIRMWARAAGRHIFDCYKYTGAFEELLAELEQAEDSPQFEFTATGVVGGVPLSGKPDCRFIHASGAHVMLDWKVNGYCSTRAVSPKKLYAMVRDGQVGLPSRNAGNSHKGYKPKFFKGLTIGSHYLEEANPDWADQLAIYGWMAGETPGTTDMVARIDQIVSRPEKPLPLLRVANHRARISRDWQLKLITRLQDCWAAIQSGHIFTDVSREESDQRREVLDMVVEDMREDDDPIWASLKGVWRK